MDEIVVGARGPLTSHVLLVGERPGETEAATGRPFTGRAGKEQDRYMHQAGLNPYSIRMTNLVKDYAEGNPDPTAADVERWSHKLQLEISLQHPEFIIPVGRFAVRYFLGDDVEMDHVHGIPQRSSRAPNSVILPTFHPAGGFYDDEARPLIAYDYERAGLYINGRIPVEFQEDEHPHPLYTDCHEPDTLWRYLASNEGAIAIDTEGIPGAEWSWQVCVRPGTGLTIRASSPNFAILTAALQDFVNRADIVVILHNAMYDLEMCAGMGLDLFDCALFDTRYAAYILRVEPQGLKALAARHCAMTMASYDETIGPVGLEKQLTYLGRILEVGGWPKPESRIKRENDGTARLYTPQPVGQRAEAILNDYYSEKLDKAGKRTDPYARWKQVDRELRHAVESKLGPMPIGTLADIPLSDAIYYAGRDPDATLRLYHRLLPVLATKGLTQLQSDGCAVLPVFEEMQRSGMLATRAYFEMLQEEMLDRKCQLQSYISHHFLQGRPFNPNSGDQVAMLMRRRGLVGEKKSRKTGKVSTAKKSIEHLRYEDDAIAHVIDWREHEKIDSSFCKPLLERIGDRDSTRIHTHINPYKVVSRRISSSDPNLTAVPVRNELGLRVRDGFTAEEGCDLGSWDLSQVEMRYMAHESRDPLLVRFFSEIDPATGKPRDVHSETAARIFGIDIRDVQEMEHRYPAKRAGFGIITNIMGQGLLDQLRMFGCKGWDVPSCDKLIVEWLKVYKGVNVFMQEAKAEAHRFGYVRDHWGMIRYLPGVYSEDPRVVAEAERAASSMKIQGGAQGMLQQSIVWLKPYIRGLQLAGARIQWLLQIHDEIILEFQEDLWESIDPLVVEALTEHSMKLIVPIKAKGSRAKQWGHLKA